MYGFPGDKYIGRLVELAASPEKVHPRVTGLRVKKPFRAVPPYIPWSCVHWHGADGMITVEQSTAAQNAAARLAESDIILNESVLDRHRISTSGDCMGQAGIQNMEFMVDAGTGLFDHRQ